MSEKIIKSGLDQIILAVDGAKPQTYNKVRVGGDFSKAVNNIRSFLSLRDDMKAAKPHARLQIIVMTETQAEIKEFKKQWEPFLRRSDSFYIKKLGFYAYNANLVCEKREGLPFRVPCELFPYRNLTFLADGRATVCCYDWNGEMVVGDASHQSVEEIWHSPKMKDFCTAHYNADFSNIPLCNKCEWTTKYSEFELRRTLKFLFNTYIGSVVSDRF